MSAARAAAGRLGDVEVLDRELLGALHRMRCGRGVEAKEVVRIDGRGLARAHATPTVAELVALGDEPRLARVRIEAALEERFAGARLVRNRGEEALHARARRCGTQA